MNFFTHLFISKTLYRFFTDDIELDKRAFAYGNIKPDLPLGCHTHHTIKNCIFTVSQLSQKLKEEKFSVRDFSILLGEVCHYVSDFFCYYHVNENIYNKLFQHFLYELRLHLEIFMIRLKRKFNVFPSMMEPRENILSILFEMHNDYLSKSPSMKNDIHFAFMTTIWISESIICYVQDVSDITKRSELNHPPLSLTEGGHI